MKRRRRLNTNSAEKKKNKPVEDEKEEDKQQDPTLRLGEMMTARGKLMGAIKDAIDPPQPPSPEESDSSDDGQLGDKDSKTDEDSDSERDKPPPRASYVLKLFDRSVDLSQFNDDTPLYPICRAWMLNQPKANYKQLGQRKEAARHRQVQEACAAGRAELVEVQLPPPVPPAPPALQPPLPSALQRPDPVTAARRLDDVLQGGEEGGAEGAKEPGMHAQELLRAHLSAWSKVRAQHTRLAALNEARYARTQALLDSIVVL